MFINNLLYEKQLLQNIQNTISKSCMRLVIHPEFFCVKNIWTASAGEDDIFRPDARLLLICTKRKRELQKNWPSICIGSHVSNISSHRFVPLTISSGSSAPPTICLDSPAPPTMCLDSPAPPTIHSNTRYQMIRRTHYKAIFQLCLTFKICSEVCTAVLWCLPISLISNHLTGSSSFPIYRTSILGSLIGISPITRKTPTTLSN